MPYDQQAIDGVATRCCICGGTLDCDENCPPCDEATEEVVREEAAAEYAQAEAEHDKEEDLDPEDEEAFQWAMQKDD